MNRHLDHLNAGMASLSLSPSEMQYHYVRAVLAAEKGCISSAARRMGMHRKTLQGMLGKKAPKVRVPA